jgi:hypothetical protein
MPGTVDKLNFQVILDDQEFDAKVKQDIKLAQELNTSLSRLLDIKRQVGKFSQDDVVNNRKAQQILVDNARAQEKITREKNKTEAAQKRINAQIEKATKGYNQQSRILSELRNYALGYLSVQGVSTFLSSLVRVTGEFELQKTTLAAMIGDLNKAEAIITKIKGLAVESPFQFKELTTYAKQLSAFSVPAEELYETTKMLADISAGLGVGMDRIVLAYGQVRSAAFLRGQEVRQFTEAGIPILDELAKQFTELEGRAVSTGEVFDKISKRLVPFEMVAKVFKDMTSEGGKFYQMQEVQAETLRGKLSNLKDAYEMMLNEIGEGQSERLKGAVDWAKRLMDNYEETGKALLGLVVSYGAYKAAMLTMEVVTKTFSVANHKLLSSFKSIGLLIAKNPYATLAAGVAAMAGLIYKAARDQSVYQKSLEITNETTEDFYRNVAAEQNMLGYLIGRLETLTAGTNEYNKIRSEILRNYGQYLDDIDKEKLAIGDLVGIYDKLSSKILEIQKQKALEEGNEKLTKQFTRSYDYIFNKFKATIEALKIEDASTKRALADYVRGEIDFEDLPKLAKKAIQDARAALQAAATTPGGMFGSGISFGGYDFEVLKEDLLEVKKIIEDSRKDIEEEIGVLYGDASVSKSKAAAETHKEVASSLQKEIKALQVLKREFDAWAELGVDEKSIASYLRGYFPNIEKAFGTDFITQLNYASRILEKIKELEKEAPEEAFDLMTTLGLDKSALEQQAVKERIKSLEDLAQATSKYYETIRKWASEDFNIDGEGITLDISKIASDLNQKINEVELRAKKARELFSQVDINSEEEIAKVKEIFVQQFGPDAWEEFWNAYYRDGIAAITQLSEKEKEYEKKLAQERVDDLAKKYVKEAYFVGNIELTDMSDKTYFQIREIRKKLQGLLNEQPLTVSVELDKALKEDGVNISMLENVDLDSLFKDWEELGRPISEADQAVLRLIQSIQKAGLSTEKFGETIKKVLKGDFKKLTEEEAKALMSMVQSYLGEMQSLLSTVADYADAIRDDKLQGAIKGVSESISILGSVAEKVSKGDFLGAALSLFTNLANVIFESVTAEQELNAAIAETRNELRLLASQKFIDKDVEHIFGTDDFKKFQNAYDEAVRSHKQALDDIEKQNQAFVGRTKDNWGAGGFFGSIAAGAALGAGAGALIGGVGAIPGLIIGAFVGLATGLTGATFSAANDYAKTLQEMADSIGADLIDDVTGTFDITTLQKIKETYSDLSSESQEMLDTLIANAEIFQNAITEMSTYMTDVFGACADEMAEAFITSFKESGDAALEYGDIVSDVATNIAKSIIKSTILQNVFDEQDAKEAAAKLASGDAAGAISVVEKAMESAKELTPYIQQLLESLQPYFEVGEENTPSLGEGVKGITEDTANLLASYLNAIRADISMGKEQWASMNNYLQQIASYLSMQSLPTLAEYQAQIAANTFNTALATQSILARLESVITTEGGLEAIRTYS